MDTESNLNQTFEERFHVNDDESITKSYNKKEKDDTNYLVKSRPIYNED
jgi:hypothetical protein